MKSDNVPFDPTKWIEQFKEAGGGFVSNGHSVHFCWAFPGPPILDNIEARCLYHEMMADPERMAAVTELIGSMIPVEAQP